MCHIMSSIEFVRVLRKIEREFGLVIFVGIVAITKARTNSFRERNPHWLVSTEFT